MQPKSFFLGAVMGAIITAAVFINSRPPEQLTVATDDAVRHAAPADNSRSDADQNQAMSASAPSDRAEAAPPAARTSDPSVGATPPQQSVVDHQVRPQSAAEPVPVTRYHEALLGTAPDRDDRNRTGPNTPHEELENEPRDHDWSYFMEQSISQFLGRHREIAHFEIAGIACRTTLCEIQSFGVDENAQPRWGLIVHDMKNEPWNDFGQTGSSSATVDGRLVILTHLRRISPQTP